MLALLVAIVALNSLNSPYFLSVANFVNLFQLSIEKSIVVLTMTLVIIGGEIDLSVASVMGLAACVMAWSFQHGAPIQVAIVLALAAGVVAGLNNAFWIAYVGLPSLAVTLAGLIGYRGIARILLEDRAIGGFPDWFNTLGQQPTVGPLTASIVIFFLLFIFFAVVLHGSFLGRLVYAVGNNVQAARYSGVRVGLVKADLFVASALVAALAGVLYAARLGSVRGDTAEGFELDIITAVLLGGVSIFGGKGNLVGRRPGDPCDPEPSQRNGSCRHHRQHPELRDRRASDPLGAGPEYVARHYATSGKGEKHEKLADRRRGARAVALLPHAGLAQVAMATPGKAVSMVLLPKFLGILPFDQAHKGAEEAAKELKNPTPLQFLGPTPQNSVAGQIEIVTNATTQGVKAIMISNNSGDQIVPAAKAAQAKGIKVVTWDSPIPSAEGEDVFVAQVDFSEIGKVMADMTLDLTGPEGGKFAILSASPDAANQNAWIAAMKTALKDPKYAKLNLVDIVYGNDESEKSYTQAQALVDKYPDLKVIMAPTSVGIVAAAKALQDEKLCDKVKVSGLGLPTEMLAYTKNGCAPEFALWSFVDLGYLTYYTAYLLATGAIKAEEGREVQGRPDGRIHDHQGPDPRQRPARADGPVHGLQQGQRRGRREMIGSARGRIRRARLN